MRKIYLFLIAFLLACACIGQTKVKKDLQGNFVYARETGTTTPARETWKFLILKDGTKLPVLLTSKGKLFVNRTSKKTGKVYRQYLTVEP